MAQFTNLEQLTVDAGRDPTQYFNNFFSERIEVSPEQNDSVIAFFQSVTDNQESAVALASAVIYTAKRQGTDIMQILDEFRKYSKQELDAYLCMFLNLNRVGTSLIGTSNVPISNPYIKRRILP